MEAGDGAGGGSGRINHKLSSTTSGMIFGFAAGDGPDPLAAQQTR